MYNILLTARLSFVFLLFSLNILAQISGFTLDEKGRAIEGVSVFLSNGKVDISDVNGFFSFDDTSSHSISFDHLSYATYYLLLADYDGDRSKLNIILEEKHIELNTVEIIGSWASDNQAITNTAMTKSDLERRNTGQDVPYILQWTPSTQVYSDAGAGIGYTYMRIRGSDQERINFTINGVPLNDAESQQVFWVDLPDFATSASSVQIQRGLGLSTAGTGAFGASVNINTAGITDQPSASISSGIGSYGTYRGSVQFQSGKLANNFHLDGRLSIINSDGYIDRATSDLKSFYLSGNYVGKKQTVTLNVFSGQEVTYQAWNGVPINFVDDKDLRTYNSAGTERPGDPHDNQVDDYGQTHFQLINRLKLSNNILSNITLHYTKGKGFFELYQSDERLADFGIGPLMNGGVIVENSDLVERRWLDNDFYGALVNFSYDPINRPINIKWGGGWNKYDGQHFGEVIWAQQSNAVGTSTRFYDNQGVKTDFNLFTQFNYTLSDRMESFIDIQYRRVGYDFLGLDEDGASVDQFVSHNFVNPKIGLSYNSLSELKAYAYLGYGHKEPNRNDYTESSPVSRPVAEKMLNVEIGVEKKISLFNLNANVYLMNYKDQLIPTGQLNDVGAATRINADASYRFGVEWGAIVNLSNRLNFGLGGTISRNKISTLDFYLDSYDADFNYIGQENLVLNDVDIAFSPGLLFNANMFWQPLKNFSLLIDGKYVGRQYLDNSQEKEASVDPHYFINTTMEYSWNTKAGPVIKLKLLIQNILNHKYENYGWTYPYLFDGSTSGDYTRQVSNNNYRDIGLYPQAGINYLMGITVDF